VTPPDKSLSRSGGVLIVLPSARAVLSVQGRPFQFANEGDSRSSRAITDNLELLQAGICPARWLDVPPDMEAARGMS
jgi:hypothetical protein